MLILLILGSLLLVMGVGGCSNETVVPDDSQLSEFSEMGGCGIMVDYNSNISVKNEKDVGIVFNQYINWARENNASIFGSDGNNWRFENATIHGTYNHTNYWKVNSNKYSSGGTKNGVEIAGGWTPKNVFDVSGNGEVVRLLGCV